MVYIYYTGIEYIRKEVCYLKAVSKSAKVSPDAKRIIKELKSGELEVRNVPEEFALDSNVVKAERKLGLRKSGHRGFDVITQTFFVEEDWFHKDLSGNLVSRLHKMTFDSFEEYYGFWMVIYTKMLAIISMHLKMNFPKILILI